MRVIIAGGRDRFVTPIEIEIELRALGWKPRTLICGMARGIDMCGHDWALLRNVRIEKFFADWALYGRRAGPLRNEAMAKVADALLAFPSIKSTGTRDMIRRARAHGLKVHVVEERL